jgi:hypothetical protein
MNELVACSSFILFIILINNNFSFSQTGRVITENRARNDTFSKKSQNVRIVFYNTENLYDPYNDSLKLDDEFTASGSKHWTYGRFREKLNHLAKLFLAIGEWQPPALIGLCEIENDYVLKRLIYDTPLNGRGYRFIHYDSPDPRGVDVALLYRPSAVRILASRPIRVSFPFDTAARTRDILYVRAVVFGSDTIHLFVNHWPSRRGGAAASAPRRNFVAALLRGCTDSILASHPRSAVIITGDLNDEPFNESIGTILKAKKDTAGLMPGDLVDLMAPQAGKSNSGTIRYQGRWSVFDQFIVSGNLMKKGASVKTSFEDAHIFSGNFLLQDDTKFMGSKLNRTYVGPRYAGGFSDHLPVFLDIWKGH